MMKPTKTSATEKAYRDLAKKLVIQAEKELNLYGEDQIHPVDFAKWLIGKKPGYTKNTWRLYKAAVVFYFDSLAEIEPAYGQAATLIGQEPQTGCRKRGSGKTSSKKSKNIPQADFEKLIARLKETRSLWAKRAALMVEAGVHTGLRPVEWESARLTPDETGLAVRNAKATNGRANGEARTVPIQNGEVLNVIKENLSEIWGYLDAGGNIKTYAHRSSVELRRTVVALFGPKVFYPLYSARHQYSANMKNVAGLDEVAKRMGHSRKRTTRLHYGKKRSGWSEYQKRSERIRPEYPRDKPG